MIKLYKSKDVLHSIVWLMLYLVTNTIAGNLATNLNANYKVVSANKKRFYFTGGLHLKPLVLHSSTTQFCAY